MKIMTGKTGAPHVTSQQFRQLVEGTVGQDSYILTSGENLEPELQTNNLLKIRSGMMSHHGNLSVVEIGTYDEVTIQNGTQGMQRIDLVVNRYTKDEETGIESSDWVVIQGTPAAESPTVPEYTEGNLQNGDLVDDCPVFEVHLNGINVTEVKKLLSVIENIPELIGDLDKRVSGIRQTGTGGWIYACKNGGFIDIAVNLSGCLVGKTYEWYNIGYVDITSLGATKTDAAFGLASFSNAGGPEFGDTGGKTTISCVAQTTGRIQLRAQSSKTISEGRQYIAMIKVPVSY